MHHLDCEKTLSSMIYTSVLLTRIKPKLSLHHLPSSSCIWNPEPLISHSREETGGGGSLPLTCFGSEVGIPVLPSLQPPPPSTGEPGNVEELVHRQAQRSLPQSLPSCSANQNIPPSPVWSPFLGECSDSGSAACWLGSYRPGTSQGPKRKQVAHLKKESLKGTYLQKDYLQRTR